MTANRVLVVKMSSLGDVVHALPAVTDAVRAGYAVDWVVEEAFADIPALHPGVDKVIPIAWRRWRKQLRHRDTSRAAGAEMRAFYRTLRERAYHSVVDSQGLIKSAAVALLAVGRRHGFAHTVAREPWAAFAYRRSYPVPTGQHAIDRQRQLFAAALGYSLTTTASSGLASAPVSSRQVVLLHGTTWASKHWPDAMWRELVGLVRADGFEPVVTWGDAREQTRAENLAEAGATLQPRLGLAELSEVLRRAALVIGVDSGLCHLSAALGAPTLGLYGPTSGELTGCRGLRAQSLQGEAHCAPCLRPTCTRFRGAAPVWQGEAVQPPCFAVLSPEVVWRSGRTLMAELV